MTPSEILEHIGEQLEEQADYTSLWTEGSSAMPTGIPDFLQDSQWQDSMKYAGFDETHAAEAATVAETIRRDPCLLRLAWQAYWRTYCSDSHALKHWPTLEKYLGDLSGLFYFLVGLGGIPLVRAHHRRLGIPENITHDTCQQIRVESIPYYAGQYNKFGVDYPQLEWLSHYTHEPYFRLGRLEFWLEPNKVCKARAFRHHRTGRTVALALDQTPFSCDGSIFAEEKQVQWSSHYRETAESFIGNVITPYGIGTRWVVSLPKAEWELALQPDDFCLTTHIPNGGHLTPEACTESVRLALEFFPKHFPDAHPKAMVSQSWLFNNQLHQVFPPDSNVVQFQRQFYAIPLSSGPWNGLWFIFLRKGAPDFQDWPRKTTPQRLILDFLVKGHHWREASMFLLWDDMKNYGASHYISQWPYAELGGLTSCSVPDASAPVASSRLNFNSK